MAAPEWQPNELHFNKIELFEQDISYTQTDGQMDGRTDRQQTDRHTYSGDI